MSTKKKSTSEVVEVEEISVGKVGFMLTKAVIPADLSFEEWQGVLINVQKLGNMAQWAVGDLLVYGEDTYGERYSQAVDETGMSIKRLQQYTWVSRAIAPERRIEGLSWTHHERVASIKDTSVQTELLQKAFTEKWPVARLRIEAKLHGVEDPGHIEPTPRPLPAPPTDSDAPAETGVQPDNVAVPPSGLDIESGGSGGSRHFDYVDGNDPLLDNDLIDWQPWVREGSQVVQKNDEAKIINYYIQKTPGSNGASCYSLEINGKKIKSTYSEAAIFDEAMKYAKKADGGK